MTDGDVDIDAGVRSGWGTKGHKKKEGEGARADTGAGEEVFVQPCSPASSSSPTSLRTGTWLSRFRSSKHKDHLGANAHAADDVPAPNDPDHPPTTSTAAATTSEAESSTATWHHHDRYFPVYSDADIFGPTSAPSAAATSPYTFTSPFENALTPIELQAIEHSKMSGRPVVVHYPDLPAFKDYLQGKTPEAIGWNSPKWGTQGWTGYGWGGGVLPDKEGKTFGVPMPEGKTPAGAGGGGGGKKKGKGGAGGGEDGLEDGEGGDDDGEKEGGAAEGGEDGTAGEADAGGTGGGGGGKNKKKKKK